VTVWRVKQSVSPSEHEFKYRLAYVVAGECVLRYDNERGKGDHRHVGSVETPYTFSTPDQLMTDFSADIARWDHEHGRSCGTIRATALSADGWLFRQATIFLTNLRQVHFFRQPYVFSGSNEVWKIPLKRSQRRELIHR
jgi:hypothetical protein